MAQTHSLDLERSSTQYASISNASQVGLGLTTDFTLEAWIKLEQLPSASGADMNIVEKAHGGGDAGYRWFIPITDKMHLNYWNASADTTDSSTAVIVTADDVGQWIHIAVTVDLDGVIRMYKNGLEVAVTDGGTRTTTMTNGTNPFVIGATSGAGALYDGLIKDVRVFNDIRTQAEIIADAHTQNVSNANLVGEWNFNNSYADTSGNGNTLTATGSPVFSATYPWDAPTGVSTGANLPTNLVGYWSMDETSGTRNDSTANALHLTDNNTVGSAAGKKSNAADFEAGNSEYFSKADAAALEISGDFTLAGWFNFESLPTAGGNMTIANRDPDDNANRVWAVRLIESGGNYLMAAYNSSGGGNATTTGNINFNVGSLSTATWYHLAWVFRNGRLMVYVNGQLKGEATGLNASMYTGGSAQLTIGSYDTGVSNFFDGLMDELGMWGRALNYGDILDLYNAGNALAYTGVQTFDQAVTATVSVTSSVIKQMSKTLTATTTPSASVVKQMAKSIVATATATANMVKQMSQTLIATATVTAAMTAMKVFLQALTATVNVTASIAKTPGKLLTATSTVTASVAKSLSIVRTLVATASVTGIVLKRMSKTLVATTTVASVITKTPGKLLTATANVTASVARSIGKVLVADVTVSATIDAGRAVIMIATATVTAVVTKTPGKLLTAVASIIAKVSAPFWRTKYPAHGDGDDYEIKYPHD